MAAAAHGSKALRGSATEQRRAAEECGQTAARGKVVRPAKGGRLGAPMLCLPSSLAERRCARPAAGGQRCSLLRPFVFCMKRVGRVAGGRGPAPCTLTRDRERPGPDGPARVKAPHRSGKIEDS